MLLDADVYRDHGFAACLVNPVARVSVPDDQARFFVTKIQRLAAVIEVFPSQTKEISFDLFRMDVCP